MLKVKNYKKNVDLISRNNSHDKGITLVALVITIIVMLILVGVSVNEAFNKGIFETAKDAAKQTEIESDRETLLSAVVTSLARKNGNTASYIEDNLPNGWEVTGADGGPYKAKSPNGNIFVVEKDGTIRLDGEAAPTPPEEDAPITPPEDDPITPPKTFPGGWTETTKPEGWSNRVIAITDGKNNIIPLPDGYDIIGENTIEKGVIIRDSKENDFVWIPVTGNLVNPYNPKSGVLEPKKLNDTVKNGVYIAEEYDTQSLLNRMYTDNFYNYATDFDYNTHYKEMVDSVNKYHGFYVGRYETTIDGSSIGSKYNTTVLTAGAQIQQTNNRTCYWYGLYYTQRNSNVVGNKNYLQTNMIWGQQWDKMISYFDSKNINYSAFEASRQEAVVNSGMSTNPTGAYDVLYNISDLRTNGYDYTAEAGTTEGSTTYKYRGYRGGCYSSSGGNANAARLLRC